MRRALAAAALTWSILLGCIPTPGQPGPPPTPDPTPRAGICGRTPEVQSAIIRALAQEGPGLSCREIDFQEMYRLREIRLEAPYLLPGDLHGLANLKKLDAAILESWPAAGSLEGMPQMEELRLEMAGQPRDWHVERGTFRRLERLEKLEIRGNRNLRPRVRVHLGTRSLDGLEQLRELRVDGVESIEPAALARLKELRRVDLRASWRTKSEEPTAPELPPEIFDGLDALEKTRARGFGKAE